MYKIGDIFKEDAEYSKRAEFCNANGLMIVEIEKTESGGRQFQIQEVPAPSQEELLINEIAELKSKLEKYKEDVEQVELFSMERTDYEQKKSECAEIILKLRELEKELKDYE